MPSKSDGYFKVFFFSQMIDMLFSLKLNKKLGLSAESA